MFDVGFFLYSFIRFFDKKVRRNQQHSYQPDITDTMNHPTPIIKLIKFCPNCGSQLQSGTINFCPACEKNLHQY